MAAFWPDKGGGRRRLNERREREFLVMMIMVCVCVCVLGWVGFPYI